jgi:hypothetical protein
MPEKAKSASTDHYAWLLKLKGIFIYKNAGKCLWQKGAGNKKSHWLRTNGIINIKCGLVTLMVQQNR